MKTFLVLMLLCGSASAQEVVLDFPFFYRCDYINGERTCECYTQDKSIIDCPKDDPTLKKMSECLKDEDCNPFTVYP